MKELTPKQPYEEFYVGFNFFRRLGADTISTATVTVTDDAASPTDVTSTLTIVGKQNIVGPQVNVWVLGGDAGHTYKFTCRIVTSSGEKHKLDASLPVVEE
jgi:hypothetical protein